MGRIKRPDVAKWSLVSLLFTVFLHLSVAHAAPSLANLRQAPSTRIINGSNAGAGEFPFMAFLYLNGDNNPRKGFFCGGFLIHPNYVLTAGHCGDFYRQYSGSDPSQLSVAIGRTDMSDNSGEIATATGIIIHPAYNPSTLENDVALIRLDRSVNLPTLALLSADEAALAGAGTQATIIGWGQTNPESLSIPERLQKAIVPIQADAVCQQEYGSEIHSDVMLCAGNLSSSSSTIDGQDSCHGDSGGPLLVRAADSTFRAAGIVSWGFGCASDTFHGVYARVSALTDWIYSFPPAPPYFETSPSISGEAVVGNRIKCETGTLTGDPATFIQYQWSSWDETGNYAEIIGANSSELQLTEDLVGSYVYCTVIASNNGGSNYAFSDDKRVESLAETADILGPNVHILSRHCSRKKCEILFYAADDKSGVAQVSARIVTRKCKRKICKEKTKTWLATTNILGEIYYAQYKRPSDKKNTYVVIGAVDARGNSQRALAEIRAR